MNFFQAVASGFKNYFNFKGRAPRSEYWYWILFIGIIGGILSVVDEMIFHPLPKEFSPFSDIFSLVTALPTIFVSIRRLHDLDRRGWWLLINLTGIGIFVTLYWYIKGGIEGDNRFGSNPLTVK